MSPPVGPTGLPEMCDGSGPPTWQLTVAVDRMATTIVMDQDVALRETAVTATIGHFVTPRLGWSVTAGAIVEGSIEDSTGETSVRGGATLAGAASYLAVYEKKRHSYRPFVALSASLGTALLRAGGDSWSAWDARVGAMVGKTFFERLVPYAAVRVFGGPVFWRGDTGGDRYHVTAGLGLILRLPARISISLEGMPLGERSASAAIGTRF